jgi:hypothetical protein
MNNIKRYDDVACSGSGGDCWSEMREEPNGNWVSFENHQRIVTELEQKLAERDRDAERYRWLRENSDDVGIGAGRICYMEDYRSFYEFIHINSEELDKEIDAALNSARGG